MKFKYIILGKNLIKATNGFIHDDLAAAVDESWTIYKAFYEEKNRYGELYINIGNKGSLEIAFKDPNYAHDLLQGLAEELKDEDDLETLEAKDQDAKEAEATGN